MIPAILSLLGYAAGTPAAPALESRRTGGISHRYPRKCSIRGRIYTVRNAQEERELLRSWAEQVADEAKVLAVLGDMDTAKKATRFVQKLDKRIAKADNREAEWIQRLRQDDEEIIRLMFGGIDVDYPPKSLDELRKEDDEIISILLH